MSLVLLSRHGQANLGFGDYDQLSDLGRAQTRHLASVLVARGQAPDRIVCGELKRQRESAEILSSLLGGAAVVVDPRWDEYDFMSLIVRVKPMYRRRWVMVADLARTGNPQRRLQGVVDLALDAWVRGDDAGALHAGDGAREEEALAGVTTLVDPRDGSLVTRPSDGSSPLDLVEPREVETFAEFQARAGDALRDASARQGTTLVVASAGTIAAAAAPLLGIPGPGFVDLQRIVVNGSVTKVVSGARGLTLVSFNEHGHMEGVPGVRMTYR